jgi:hypothetical protein
MSKVFAKLVLLKIILLDFSMNITYALHAAAFKN